MTYRKSESIERPETVEMSKTTVYLRKNITETTRTDMDEQTYTVYEYDETAMSYEEYADYQAELRLDDIETVIAEIIGGGDV